MHCLGLLICTKGNLITGAQSLIVTSTYLARIRTCISDHNICPHANRCQPLSSLSWACSVFHCSRYLSAIFIPSIGLKNAIAHIGAKCFPPGLSDYQQSLSLLNTEMSLMRKTVIQNRMTWTLSFPRRRHLCHYPNRMLDVQA